MNSSTSPRASVSGPQARPDIRSECMRLMQHPVTRSVVFPAHSACILWLDGQLSGPRVTVPNGRSSPCIDDAASGTYECNFESSNTTPSLLPRPQSIPHACFKGDGRINPGLKSPGERSSQTHRKKANYGKDPSPSRELSRNRVFDGLFVQRCLGTAPRPPSYTPTRVILTPWKVRDGKAASRVTERVRFKIAVPRTLYFL